MAELKTVGTLYVVNDPKSKHYGKYVRKIYTTNDSRWACQTFDKSEKMFLSDSQLISKTDWGNKGRVKHE